MKSFAGAYAHSPELLVFAHLLSRALTLAKAKAPGLARCRSRRMVLYKYSAKLSWKATSIGDGEGGVILA